MKRNTSKNLLYIVADFETVVYEGQKDTAVWSACWAELYNDAPDIVGSIEEFMQSLISYKRKLIVYFHNLRFDGTFILSYLLSNGCTWDNSKNNEMRNWTFKALISDKNRFYSITIKTSLGDIIEFRDSLKLIPFSLSALAKAFNTKHKKLTMEYKGKRYPNCPITANERQYILNDVLVLKEVMEIMISRGHDKLTIGACCVKEYKATYDRMLWNAYYTNLKDIPCLPDMSMSSDDYIRKTYKGAWCYLKKAGEYLNGATYDVNSLYPSVMHSVSGNYYPVGTPTYFFNSIPDRLLEEGNNYVWFIHIKCHFQLKPGFLPTIQIKKNLLYNPTEWLETSDIKFRGKYYREFIKDGVVYDSNPELYLTFKDYELLHTHYIVEDEHILDGCYFKGELGIFDEYIDTWMNKKETSTNKVDRTESKLFLNNLYGKLASSDNSSYQQPYLDEDNIVQYDLHAEFDKPVFSIDKGSMVTSYARYFTITHAQKNYDTFIYADTDSIHMLDVPPINIDIHPTHLLCWKKERRWRKGIFIRAKTYAELPIEEDGEKVYPAWKITCAGMPERSKRIFLSEHPITDFKYGLSVRGKLIPKRIPGGMILVDSNFTLNKR